ncbi:ABC transporter ATP-binding protein [Kitasatospora sp. NBC_01287]|uniref:ABC transporter ATP-binding protein n=1 Tax=Kitasatospora sp. NBC_01287 TaxID=2903573 RepID=UPI00225B06CD|nr:ABC transporter ATP-binding protein [Kitasatospora sp. NBC_01287]MCX4750285.1 ABC transporter ATP-binding protein [Kitasatospora sp. NBC_01287]
MNRVARPAEAAPYEETELATEPLEQSEQAPALEFSGLFKQFGENVAVDHIDLVVPRGSFFGLVGPNGAGKTTSLSMATGLLRPDGGTARIFGRDVWTDPVAAKALIGVLPDGMALPDRLTGREVLTYLGLLRGMEREVVEQRADELLRVLELDSAESTVVVDYSTGMRKKITLATALLHGPKLLVLDEPFEAVDPVSAATIRTILQRFVASGGSVVFSSHVMALVERLCDHVAVIAKGRVEAYGALDEVRGGQSLEDAFVHIVGARTGGAEGLSWLAS